MAEVNITDISSHKLHIGFDLTNTTKVKLYCEGRDFSFPIMGFGTKNLTVCHNTLIDESLQKQLTNNIKIQAMSLPLYIKRLLMSMKLFVETFCSIPNLHTKSRTNIEKGRFYERLQNY